MNSKAILYELKLRLTSSWLGSQRTRENVRRFRRDKDGKLAVDLSQWSWTFKQAADALHLQNVDTDTIRPQANIDPPTLVLYRRSYTHNNKAQFEMFEAMRENTVITFNAVVTGTLYNPREENIQTAPTEEELKNILAFTGKFLGLSPWGGNYGYGRFEIENITKI